MSWMEVVGGIYSLQPLPSRWLTLLSMGKPDSPCGAPDTALFTVWCVPHQPTIVVWSCWSLKSSVLLRHRTVRCILTSALFTVPPSAQSTVSEVDRCSVGSPDSPVAHRTVQWFLVEWLYENPRAATSRGLLSGHRTVSDAPLAASILLCSKLCRVSQTHFLCWFMLNFMYLR
jgi:hypothetical protein